MKLAKVLILSSCYHCPYRERLYKQPRCKNANEDLPQRAHDGAVEIPDFCPLPDAETENDDLSHG